MNGPCQHCKRWAYGLHRIAFMLEGRIIIAKSVCKKCFHELEEEFASDADTD